MLQSTLAASILFVATICFSAFHTWPYGFPIFDLLWKRYYGIMRFWPETIEDSGSRVIPPGSFKVERVTRLSLAAVARWFLPLLLGFDGILKAPQIFYAPFLTFPSPYDEYLQSIGAITLLASLLIMTWASSFLVRYVYGRSPDQRTLIRSGPYRYVRHPVYLSFILFGIGTVLVSLNFLMLITFSYMVFMAYTYQSEEERELSQKHGIEYEEYKKSTGGLLPRISWYLDVPHNTGCCRFATRRALFPTRHLSGPPFLWGGKSTSFNPICRAVVPATAHQIGHNRTRTRINSSASAGISFGIVVAWDART